MDFVPIDLAGRTYRLRFTPDDIQDICRRLTTFQPVGGGKVTPVMLGNLLLNLDPDAFQFCIWAGLRHMKEYARMDPADAQKLIRLAIQSGQQYTDLRRPIFRALVACGLADFSGVIKALDDAEAQRDQDGAIDMGADAGNVLPEATVADPSTSMTLSSTPRSAAGVLESLT